MIVFLKYALVLWMCCTSALATSTTTVSYSTRTATTSQTIVRETGSMTRNIGCLCRDDSSSIATRTLVSRTRSMSPTRSISNLLINTPSRTISNSITRTLPVTSTSTQSLSSTASLPTATLTSTLNTPTLRTATESSTLRTGTVTFSRSISNSLSNTMTVSRTSSLSSSLSLSRTLTSSKTLSKSLSIPSTGSTVASNTVVMISSTVTETIPKYSLACCPGYTPPPRIPPPASSDDDGSHWGGVPGWGWLIIGIACGCCILLIVVLIFRGGMGGGYTQGKSYREGETLEEMKSAAQKGDTVEVSGDDKEMVQGIIVDTNETGVWVQSESWGAAKFFNDYRVINSPQFSRYPPVLPQRDFSTLSSARFPGEPPAGNEEFPAATAPVVYIEHNGTMSINNLRQVQVVSPTSPNLDSAFPPSPSRGASANVINSNFGNLESSSQLNKSSAQAPFKSLPFEYPEPVKSSSASVGFKESSAPPLSPLV